MDEDGLPPELLQALSSHGGISDDEKIDFLKRAFMPPDMTVAGLRESHSELCSQLKKVEPVSAFLLIAGLSTLPSLQDNSIRIDVLLHLAFVCCRADQEASIDDLEQWMKYLRSSPTAPQEDPPEDVFVGYVNTVDGGFRVFPGLISHADFILERLLVFLHEKVNFPSFLDVYQSVRALLKVSDAVAEALGLPRYYTDQDRPDEDLLLPEKSILEEHVRAIRFSRERLESLGVKRESLDVFVFDIAKVDELASQSLFGSSIECCPLIKDAEELVVASPSSLCRAAVMLILEAAPLMGGWAETFYEKESAEFFVNQVLKGLEVEPLREVQLPNVPESLPLFYPYVGQFDLGMPVIALTKTSSIIQGSDLEQGETFTDEQVEDLTQYLADCCEELEQLPGFKGGLILLALAGVGRPMALGLRELKPEWHLFSAALAEWHTLSGDHDFNARRLWYLGLQQDMVKSANIEFQNVGGLMNLYGYWKRQYFSLIPVKMDPKNPNNMLILGGDCSQDVNVRLKFISDRHCLKHPQEQRWIEVKRQGEGLNPDLQTNLQYCDYSSVYQDMLRGCVSKGEVAWWIEVTERPKAAEAFSVVYRLWDCVMNWCERILKWSEEEQPVWLPDDAVVQLNLHEVDSWDLQAVTQRKSDEGEIGYDVHISQKLVELNIGEDFLSKFYCVDNLAEREIVSVMIQALSVIGDAQLSPGQIEEYVWKVVRDEHSRFFHVLNSVSLESAIGESCAKPLLIPDEEISRVRIGLAYTVDRKPPNRISDRDEARKFLDSVVRGIQSRLSDRLKQIHSLPVVSHSFNQLDELSRDDARWEFSTRSLLSLEENAAWLHERLRQENGRSTLAEIANRALIETVSYSHDPKADEIISQTEHLSLLAEIAMMIQLASYRDAVANGLVDTEIIIHPNGQIEYDDDFQNKVMQPYLTSRSDDRIRWNAESYGDHFVKPETEEYQVKLPPELEPFELAFVAEYGFDSLALDKFADEFAKLAMETGVGGGSIDDPLLRHLLEYRLGFTEEQIDTFIDRFVLRIRPAWNKGWPTGYKPNDVLPWRFFRGLSILVRPIVEVSKSPSVYAISATHLQRWRRYFLGTVIEGDLPERIFISEEMKAYRGDFAERTGNKFEKRVVEELEKMLLKVRHRVKMSEMGKTDSDPSDDVDVMAWDKTHGVVFLIECKHLKPVLTVAQAIRQLQNFKGNTENKEDYLAKHLRRIKWLQENPDEVTCITGIQKEQIRWIPLLVCSGRVPMAHLDAIDFPKEQVVAFQDLKTRITGMVSG